MAEPDLSVDPERERRRRLRSAEEAVGLVESGDLVWIPSAHQAPALLALLATREKELRGVRIRSVTLPNLGWFREDAQRAFDLQVQVPILPDSRRALWDRIIDSHPYWTFQQHKAADCGREEGDPIDVLILVCRPPDERGWLCVGNACWDAVTSARRARKVLVETSPHLPRTCGDSWIHISQVDALVEGDRPLLAGPEPTEFSDLDRGLAAQVKTLVRDGDTLQIGLGHHTGALPLCGAFDDANDLGYFGELTVPGTVGLVRRGNITCRRVELHPGRFVSCHLGNSPDDLAYIEDNPFFLMKSSEYTNDPRVICRHENLLALNGALCMDLSGQIGVYAVGDRMYSGMGGHLAFALGAMLSRAGRYATILPSVAGADAVSTIVPQFPAGQIVGLPRELADTVVTEQGVARLLGRSVRERSAELVAVAHPRHRDWLRDEARRLFWP